MERLKDCMEELLKFTVKSYIDETLDLHLGISKEFCSDLLRDEPNDGVSSSTDFDFDEDCSLQGVPPYPLYKRLALALCRSVVSGDFCTTCRKVPLMNEDSFLEQKEEEWSQLILNKGSQLVNLFGHRIAPGAVILLNKCMTLQVQCVRHHDSFPEMLEAESLEKVLPGVKTIEEGVQIYRNFYAEEKERYNGVLAICVSKVATQPCATLASLLSGLSYGGIQSLLGLAHTVGTISDALPPPRSTLLSSFMLPFKPNIKGSTLTHGARALAKHAARSSNRYWGKYDGSDSDKNRLAMDVIGHLIVSCCWLNVHIVQPHGIVFEIRVADGYGARWSKDGTKFIGFLEPYMEDGHSKGWKH
ncbi:RNA-binding ASCH domain protein [Melia azedarach]|uniref:RNA-binding ASCH domain protein n=1 Tax=Melia azedarach TaxID=155640 RepID=A0ACC1YJA8_MELAZ|nr:RNA-binding ASCH domain protein [Melia azedarach]